MTALAYALQLLDALKLIAAAGKDVKVLIDAGRATLQKMQDEGRDPTPEEWTALNTQIDALRAELASDTAPGTTDAPKQS